MHSLRRELIFLTVFVCSVQFAFAQQPQDKQLANDYMEQADLIMAGTKAMDDARDLMALAANADTTNIKANFEAGHMHLLTIGKDRATRYFLRIYRQKPDYRFDLEYWIGKGYQYGLDFDNALKYYSKYFDRLGKNPNYQGEHKVELKEVERRIIECKNGKEFVANPKNYSIINIGSKINSEFDDYAPVLNEKEDEIVFTTRRREGNTNENVADDNLPYEDVFNTKKVGANWSVAKNIGTSVNTKFNDSNLAMSADSKTLFLYKDEGNGDIYFSDRQPNGSWSVPKALPGVINSTYRESSISISRNGKTIYFASERPGGLGGSDIYVCAKDAKGEWSNPKNLGPGINTDLDEDAPFIDYDEQTLFFSSHGRKGMGGYDIFKSKLINEAKNEWSEPENLGYPINTPDDDVFYVSTTDGKRGYYASVRDDGMGYSDIYMITVPEKKPAKEEPKKLIPLQFIVNVVDADREAPLTANVKLIGMKDNVVVGMSTGEMGTYNFSITSATQKDYRLSVEKEGYIFVNEQLTIAETSAEPKTLTKVVKLRKLVVGATSVLRNIYFDFNKASFKQDSYTELNKLEGMMKQNESVKVEIAGHTDSFGPDDFNLKLSSRRANAVRSFLTSKGIDPRRVTAVGYGDKKPLASNDDEKDGRELNRRVEFKVLGN
jgi:outer membrane protein OmpA-like peptidoglycan-associated protein